MSKAAIVSTLGQDEIQHANPGLSVPAAAYTSPKSPRKNEVRWANVRSTGPTFQM